MNTIKIAIYYHKIEQIGGVEKSILNLSKLFSSQGHDVTVIFSDMSSDIDMLIKIGSYANVKYIDYCKEEEYDYVFFETIKPVGIRGLNNILIINNNWLDNKINRRDIGNFDEYIAVGQECQKQAEKVLNEKVKLIPNIIDIDNIIELSKEQVKITKGDITFLTVSRITAEKGFNNMLYMISKLEERKINYRWYIVGEGNLNIKYKFKNCSNVIFLGAQDNPYKYMKNVDYLVQLSYREAQCLVMFEALILGTPVIVTDFGTALETVNNTNGIILKKDMSNLDINKIINSKFNFNYEYPNVNKKWLELLKPEEIKDYKFTVLIPNYNNSEWLDKCLTSVLNQTYKNYEIIFVDDMSEDNSLAIANKLLTSPHKIIPLRSKRYNGGARNEGILEATGDYIVCLDSDDWFANNKVLEDINKTIRNEDVIFLGFQQDKNGKLYADFMPKYTTQYEALTNDVCAIWTKVVRTSLMQKCLFSEGTLMEDRVQHYRICNKMKRFRCYPKITHIWNRGNSHSVTTDRGIKWETSIYRFIADLQDFYYECSDEFKNYIQGKIDNATRNAQQKIFKQI